MQPATVDAMTAMKLDGEELDSADLVTAVIDYLTGLVKAKKLTFFSVEQRLKHAHWTADLLKLMQQREGMARNPAPLLVMQAEAILRGMGLLGHLDRDTLQTQICQRYFRTVYVPRAAAERAEAADEE